MAAAEATARESSLRTLVSDECDELFVLLHTSIHEAMKPDLRLSFTELQSATPTGTPAGLALAMTD